MIPTLCTSRLILSPFDLSDALLVQQYAGHPDVARTTLHVPHPYPDGGAEKWIAAHLLQFLEQRNVVLAVRTPAGELIGAMSAGQVFDRYVRYIAAGAVATGTFAAVAGTESSSRRFVGEPSLASASVAATPSTSAAPSVVAAPSPVAAPDAATSAAVASVAEASEQPSKICGRIPSSPTYPKR